MFPKNISGNRIHWLQFVQGISRIRTDCQSQLLQKFEKKVVIQTWITRETTGRSQSIYFQICFLHFLLFYFGFCTCTLLNSSCLFVCLFVCLWAVINQNRCCCGNPNKRTRSMWRQVCLWNRVWHSYWFRYKRISEYYIRINQTNQQGASVSLKQQTCVVLVSDNILHRKCSEKIQTDEQVCFWDSDLHAVCDKSL